MASGYPCSQERRKAPDGASGASQGHPPLPSCLIQLLPCRPAHGLSLEPQGGELLEGFPAFLFAHLVADLVADDSGVGVDAGHVLEQLVCGGLGHGLLSGLCVAME